MNKFQRVVLVFSSVLLIMLTGCVAPNDSFSTKLKSQTAAEVLVWANEAALAINSYNYVNYRENLHVASHYFTPQAWSTYISAFELSGNLDKVTKRKLVVSAVATGSPVILEEGMIDKKYTWKVQLPLLITSESTSYKQNQHIVITMVIVRTPKDIGVRGLAIEQYFLQQRVKQPIGVEEF